MDSDRLKKLNNRVLLVLLFLAVLFIMAIGVMVGSLIGNIELPGFIFIWSGVLLILIFFTLLYWYFRTRKTFFLNFKRRQVVLFASFVFILSYLLFGKVIFLKFDIPYGIIVMLSCLIYFTFKNRIKGYSTKLLLLLTAGAGVILVQIFVLTIYFLFTDMVQWNLQNIISEFLAFVPNLISKIPVQMVVLIIFSTVISFFPLKSDNDNEVLDN